MHFPLHASQIKISYNLKFHLTTLLREKVRLVAVSNSLFHIKFSISRGTSALLIVSHWWQCNLFYYLFSQVHTQCIIFKQLCGFTEGLGSSCCVQHSPRNGKCGSEISQDGGKLLTYPFLCKQSNFKIPKDILGQGILSVQCVSSEKQSVRQVKQGCLQGLDASSSARFSGSQFSTSVTWRPSACILISNSLFGN